LPPICRFWLGDNHLRGSQPEPVDLLQQVAALEVPVPASCQGELFVCR
jgi:hypothetical protein